MGYAIAMGRCFGCGAVFGFNPVRVPSIRVNGQKEPICQACVTHINPQRRANGVPEITPAPDAYSEVNESELGGD
jgi:hypothetical protein